MGISLFGSSSSYDRCNTSPPNPDPKNYTILLSNQREHYLIITIQYPDCSNYEGKKILLYEGTTINKLKEQGSIDPHFSENKEYASPIARFEPTERGASLAERLVKDLLS